ncbi:MAG: RHS repeat-associated core domain-containing protein, partial [Gaiellales bacterium]
VLANGAVQSFELDANNNSKKVETTFADGSVVSESIVHSPTGRILSRTLSGPTGTSTFAYRYNVDGRLVHTTLTGTIPTTATQWHSQYDGPTGLNGDRASKTTTLADGTQQTVAYTYGADNRPLTVSEGRLKGDIVYDAAGRATRLGGVDLTYNAIGRLLSAADGAGRSYTFTDGGATTTLTRPLADGTSSSVTVSASGDTLLLGSDKKIAGQLVALDVGLKVALDQAGAPVRWIFEDTLGNTTWRSTGTNAPARTHLYAPFGEPISATRGTTPATPLDLAINTLGWASGRGATTLRSAGGGALIMIGTRVYSPDAGRWLQADPDVNGSFNAYEYALGDPINMSDPTGNSPNGSMWGMIAATVAGVLIGVFTFGVGTFVTGAGLAAVAVQVVVAGVVGAVSGAIGNIVQQSVDSGFANINWAEVGVAAGSGAALGALTAGVGSYVTKVIPMGFVSRKLAYESVEQYKKSSNWNGFWAVVSGKRFNQLAARSRLAEKTEPTLLSAMFTTKGFFNPRYVVDRRWRLRGSAIDFDDLAGNSSFRSSVGRITARPLTTNSAKVVQQARGVAESIDSSYDNQSLMQILRANQRNSYGVPAKQSITSQQADAFYPNNLLRDSVLIDGNMLNQEVFNMMMGYQKAGNGVFASFKSSISSQ